MAADTDADADADADPDADADADADDTGAPGVDYSFGDPSFEGNIYEEGDSLTVTFDFINTSGEDDMRYPIVRLETDAVWLDIFPGDLTLYGVFASEPVEAIFFLTANSDVETGMTAEVRMKASRLHCETSEDVDCPTFEARSFTVGVEYPPGF